MFSVGLTTDITTTSVMTISFMSVNQWILHFFFSFNFMTIVTQYLTFSQLCKSPWFTPRPNTVTDFLFLDQYDLILVYLSIHISHRTYQQTILLVYDEPTHVHRHVVFQGPCMSWWRIRESHSAFRLMRPAWHWFTYPHCSRLSQRRDIEPSRNRLWAGPYALLAALIEYVTSVRSELSTWS